MARIHSFGDLRLDPATRELHRGKTPVPVPPRAFDCIVYLIEHRERAVGRDELIAAVWGKTDIGDGMLGQTILAARRALEDTGKEQLFIRTVIRFGYHWIAAVETSEDATTDSVAPLTAPVLDAFPPVEPEASPARPVAIPDSPRLAANWRRAIGASVALVVLALLAWSAFHLHRQSNSGPVHAPGEARSRIALILPITVNADRSHAWMRLGLMDLIAERLRATGLAVVPSDNIVALMSRSDDSASVADPVLLAREAGANLVFSGQVEPIANRWRVSLRTTYGENPLIANGEATDALTAARIAADRLAQQLGYKPETDPSTALESPALANVLQQVEAAILDERLDHARALLANLSPTQREQPQVRLRLAKVDYQAGDLTAAAAGFSSIVQSVSAEQDPVLRARALLDLGVIAAMHDDTTLATRHLDEAIELLRGQHAPDALGKAFSARGNVAAVEGRYDPALHDFAEARAALESAGNPLALAILDSNLGGLDMLRFHYAEAVPVFEQAAKRFSTFGFHAAELNAVCALAESRLALLDANGALALEPRLRELISQVTDPGRQRNGELVRIQILAANGRLQTTSASLATVLAAATASDDRAAIARAQALDAEFALARGDSRRAAEAAAISLRHYSPGDDSRQYVRTIAVQIEALRAVGEAARSKTVLQDLTRFAEYDRNPVARLYATLAEAESSPDIAAAGPLHEQALAEAEALRVPLDLRDTARSYVAWLLANGQFARAGAVAERMASWASNDYESALLQLRVYRSLGDADLWRSALVRVRALAGERVIPAELLTEPTPR